MFNPLPFRKPYSLRLAKAFPFSLASWRLTHESDSQTFVCSPSLPRSPFRARRTFAKVFFSLLCIVFKVRAASSEVRICALSFNAGVIISNPGRFVNTFFENHQKPNILYVYMPSIYYILCFLYVFCLIFPDFRLLRYCSFQPDNHRHGQNTGKEAGKRQHIRHIV